MFEEYDLYYPNRRQKNPALSLTADAMRSGVGQDQCAKHNNAGVTGHAGILSYQNFGSVTEKNRES
ncbi:hypothetical protein ACCS96_44645, partial [Rhizobium ruizarguesonis]